MLYECVHKTTIILINLKLCGYKKNIVELIVENYHFKLGPWAL